MNAMEKMVASMLGITPESLAAMISDAQTLASTLGGKLDAIADAQTRIEEGQRELLARMEAFENVGRNKPASRRARGDDGNASTGNGSGGEPAPGADT